MRQIITKASRLSDSVTVTPSSVMSDVDCATEYVQRLFDWLVSSRGKSEVLMVLKHLRQPGSSQIGLEVRAVSLSAIPNGATNTAVYAQTSSSTDAYSLINW